MFPSFAPFLSEEKSRRLAIPENKRFDALESETEETQLDPNKKTILIVDDLASNRWRLAEILKDEYNVIEAADGDIAVSILNEKSDSISLILLDNIMPNMKGIEVLQVMNANGWIETIPVIMISTDQTHDSISEAFNLGVTDFLQRDTNYTIIQRRIKNTLILNAKQRALVDMIEDQITAREKSVRLMVSILSQIVEFRNGESGLHVLNVNTITELLLREIAKHPEYAYLDEEEISRISIASSLHDIGKMSVPEEILNKPGRLTDEEFAIMKQHSAAGAEMLDKLSVYKDDPLLKTAYDISRWHHERYDGRGYPDGLQGDDIPISAQVVALADVYDALTSKRVYKDAFSHEEAIRMITNGECGNFNPILLKCLTDIADTIQAELKAASESEKYLPSASHAVNKATIMSASTGGTPTPSSRTLELLEHERMKSNFFAMMSGEVLFEYTEEPSLITFTDYGIEKIGLPEVVKDPYHNKLMIAMFGEDALEKLFQTLRGTTKENPIVQLDIKATVDGEPRWFHIAARAMWRETQEGDVYAGSIGKMVDVHENRQQITALEIQATHDSLTGLMHHDFARKLITERMEENPTDNFVLMVIDMDHFKDANDTYGHMFGDEVLKFLARKLRDSVRESDIVARVGGDEFLICMECDIDPEPLVKRVFEFITDKYEDFPVSISMGVVCVPGEFANYDEMFKAADAALYDMKRAGRGGYVFADANAQPSADFKSLVSTIESDA